MGYTQVMENTAPAKSTNAYCVVARQAKAAKMASALLAQAPASFWLSSEAAHPAPADFWMTVAVAAGVSTAQRGKAPSAETWALVLELLRARALFEAVV